MLKRSYKKGSNKPSPTPSTKDKNSTSFIASYKNSEISPIGITLAHFLDAYSKVSFFLQPFCQPQKLTFLGQMESIRYQKAGLF